MFDNVTIIQFDNLPNQEEACQYKQTWIQARGKEGGAIGVDPFLSTVLFPIIIYWKNNKLALQILRIVYKNFILITHIDQNSNF